MNYAVMTYSFKNRFNVGDYIQSLAARQFLPKVDHYICREKLDKYSGTETKMIMNGYFMRYPENWPPSPSIIPLFISFHMNISHAERMLTKQGIAYLRKYEPIGCRDMSTLKLLKEKNIQAYFSSCLTLTLGNSYRHNSSEDIYFVDVLYRYPTWKNVFKSFNSFQKSLKNKSIFMLGKQKNLIQKFFGKDIVQAAKQITHIYPSNEFPTEESRFGLADRILKRYEKAKLVVTSRIHCALPCLAMGTPVIFVDGGFKQYEASRFDGITKLFNTIEIFNDGSVKTNFDLDAVKENMSVTPKNEHLEYLVGLIERCKNFIDDT